MDGSSEGLAVGIDFGTSYCSVAIWKDNAVVIIPDEDGNLRIPSCVAFDGAHRLVGQAAKNQIDTNAANTITDLKRLIGRSFSDPSVQSDIKLWPFKVIASPDDKPMLVLQYNDEEKQFTAEEITSMLLAKLKDMAETYLKTTVNKAVLAVPAYFGTQQRQALEDSARIAGLNIIQVIKEPTAAAIAYAHGNNNKSSGSEKNVLIFDLGGGTCSVSLLTIATEGVLQLTEKAIAGDTHLGGEDCNDRMMDYIINEFKHATDLSTSLGVLRLLRTACEGAKVTLSSAPWAIINIYSEPQLLDLSTMITQDQFEELNEDLFRKCVRLVENCLRNVKMDKGNVHEVVLVGGSTRIPKIQQLLRDFFNGKELCKSVSSEAVAYGASVSAAKMAGLVLLNVKAERRGLEDGGGGREGQVRGE